jgi:hypothetical protein
MVDPRRGRNINTYTTVNAPPPIQLNTTTYTTLGVDNIKRLGYKITNDSAHDIIVKEQAFDDPDSDDRGFKVFKRSLYESKPDNVAIGPISAKAVSGSPFVMFVEE